MCGINTNDTPASMPASVVYDALNAFGNDLNVVSFTVFATVITWGLIQTLESTILSPLILSAFPGLDVKKDLEVGGHELKIGRFWTGLIVWVSLMLLLFLMWFGVRMWGWRKTRLAKELAATNDSVINHFEELQKAAANVHATALRFKMEMQQQKQLQP